MSLQTCNHGRPIEGPTLWDVFKGVLPCDDCEPQEWASVRTLTIVGTIALLALIWVPMVLLLAGAFW